MSVQFNCWKCGASIQGHPLPLSRNAECELCRADLYVCKMCEFYDERVSKSCREPVADEVYNKEKAHFCDYFKLKPNAHDMVAQQQRDAAVKQLQSLFGDVEQNQSYTHRDSDTEVNSESDLDEQKQAQRALRDLFRDPK